MNNRILGNAITLARRIAKVYGRNVYVATGMKGFEVYEKSLSFAKDFMLSRIRYRCLVNNTFGSR